MKIVLGIVIFALAIMYNDCAKIIAFFNIPSKSHHILGESLLKGLAAKGHDVTMYSPYLSKNVPKNYKNVVLADLITIKDEAMLKLMHQQNASRINKVMTTVRYMTTTQEVFINHNEIQKLISSGLQYDLAITVWFGNDLILALSEHIAKHTIVFNVVGSYYPIEKLTKSPAPLSYVPSLFPSLSDEMNFVDRLLNLLISILNALMDILLNYRVRLETAKHFPNAPSRDKLHEHVSLVLLNTHFSIESTRPYVPQMIQVGGLHLENPKPLTGKLKEFMDAAKEGVILFSLGANVKSSDVNPEKLQNIIRCFSKLPYKILWKFEKNDIPNTPGNVYISAWLPQFDLLAHKNLKLFISHGGLLSIMEAIYNGVPMIGIPIFADQEGNVNQGVSKGYMVKLKYEDISEESLGVAIMEVMNNPKYTDNIQKRSHIFKDQPLKPLDKALYWVEYVLKYNGAHHLKTNAFKLHWTQQYLLDVIATIFISVLMCIYLIRKIYKCFKHFLWNKKFDRSCNKKND